MASIGLRYLFLLLCGYLSSSAFGQTETISTSRLYWLGYLSGDFQKAKILTAKPSSSRPSNYGVLLDVTKFDPFEMYKFDSQNDVRKYHCNVLLLIELRADSSDSLYTLELVLNKGIPVCTDCDGGCAHLKERVSKKITKQLKSSSNQQIRHLVDISKLVKDWHLIDIKLTATLYLGKNKVSTSTISAERWPWCL